MHMKNRMKSLFALVLAMCMLVGCGTQSTNQNQEEKTNNDSQAAAEDDQADTSEYPEYLNLDGYRPIVKEGEEVTLKVIAYRNAAMTESAEDSWFWHFVEEKLNIDLELVEEWTPTNVEERKSLVFASGELPDIIWGYQPTANELVSYGVDEDLLLPMNDYISEELTPGILNAIGDNTLAIQNNTTMDGNMYTVPRMTGNDLPMTRVFANIKYLEAAGITEMPTTLDGFVDMLRTLKAMDPTELGVDEIWPLVGCDDLEKQYLMNAFGWTITYNVSVVEPCWDVEKEEIVVPCAEEKYTDYVTLLNTLYSEGLIHPDCYTMDSTAIRALMAEGKVAVLGDWAPYLSLPDGWDDYDSVAPLSSEWCEEGFSVAACGSEYGVMLVSAATEYPEVCMRLIDYLYSDEGCVYSMEGCPADSGDTLDMIQGFGAEDGEVVDEEWMDAGYDSQYDWHVNEIEISQIDTTSNKKQAKAAMVGATYNDELDVTDADQNYRYEVKKAFEGHTQDELPRTFADAETMSRYSDLQKVISNYVSAETAKFVVGDRPLDEFDDYFEELKAMGIDEYVEICRGFFANYER